MEFKDDDLFEIWCRVNDKNEIKAIRCRWKYDDCGTLNTVCEHRHIDLNKKEINIFPIMDWNKLTCSDPKCHAKFIENQFEHSNCDRYIRPKSHLIMGTKERYIDETISIED